MKDKWIQFKTLSGHGGLKIHNEDTRGFGLDVIAFINKRTGEVKLFEELKVRGKTKEELEELLNLK